jgi:transcriptional regulator with XRE-family HTH domain
MTSSEMLEMLSEHLEELRLERRMKHIEFADWLGVNRTSLEAYRNKRASPNGLVLAHIATRCHVSMDWLLGLPKKPKYPSPEHQRAALKELRESALNKLSALEMRALSLDLR